MLTFSSEHGLKQTKSVTFASTPFCLIQGLTMNVVYKGKQGKKVKFSSYQRLAQNLYPLTFVCSNFHEDEAH